MTDRALLLLRQSITAKDSVSIEAQDTATRRYCEERGYQITDTLTEESVRGWQDDRASFAAILTAAKAHRITVVVAWDVSRAARSVRILETFLHDLDRHGVRFESVSEPYISAPFVRQVLAAVAEEQTRTIARNVAGAIRRQSSRGSHHGNVPYGYRAELVQVDGKNVRRLVPIPEQAAVVRCIFERYADGWSYGALHTWLNNDPAVPPRPRGGRWSESALWFVLRLEVYTGVVSVKADKPAGRLFEDVRVEGAHEPIISRALWERVQRRLTDDRPHAREHKREHSWLEGHVRCAGCGSPMYFVVASRGPKAEHRLDRSWHCRQTIMVRNGTRADPCPAPKARAGHRWVERAVLAALASALSRGGTVTDADLRRYLGTPDTAAQKIAATPGELCRQRDRLVASIAHGIDPEVVAPKIKDLTARIDTLQRQQGGVRPAPVFDDLRRARAYAADVATALARADDDTRRAVAERLGLAVHVDAGSRSVRLTFGPGYRWLEVRDTY